MVPVYVYGAGEMPLPEEIRQCGLKTGESVEGNREGSWLRDAMGSLANLGAQKVREPRKAEMVHLGEGLMPLPRRTVERIQAGEFVEFAEFPVLDDGSRVEQVEQELGDRVVILQAPERKRNRRQVPDASLWGSCYTLYERTVLRAEPDRVWGYRLLSPH